MFCARRRADLQFCMSLEGALGEDGAGKGFLYLGASGGWEEWLGLAGGFPYGREAVVGKRGELGCYLGSPVCGLSLLDKEECIRKK